MPRKSVGPLEHFRRNTKLNDNGCLEWTGTLNHLGYGVFVNNKRRTSAHRFSFSFFRGRIPTGIMVLHKCHNPACVNPDHLKLGTHLENMADRKQAGNYEIGPNRKLTEEQVMEIYNTPGSENSIAPKFGVHRSVVNNIRSGKLYKSITGGKTSPFHRPLKKKSNEAQVWVKKEILMTGTNGEQLQKMRELNPQCWKADQDAP